MHFNLLKFLVCPRCKGDLTLKSYIQKPDEVVEGKLECEKCRITFPITNGIPNMIPSDISDDKQKTSDFFEKDWRIFDTKNKNFDELLPSYIAPLTLNSLKDKLVLEAGCGSGRNLITAAKAGAKEIVGIDISGSVKLAYKKTENYPNIHIIQADILQSPLRPIFNIIFSVGALHHLPNPEKGFLDLVNYLQPSGIMVISVYSKENNEWIIKYINPIRKNILSKIPDRISIFVSFMAAGLTYPIMKLLYKPLNEFESTKQWAKNNLFYNDFLYLLSQLSFKLVWGQFWDQLTAPTAFYISRTEIEKWHEKAGLKNISLMWRNRNCWNAVGMK